jgi:hypothetical protein
MQEGFQSSSSLLPNTDIPNKNYPSEYPITSNELDKTSKCFHPNEFHHKNKIAIDKQIFYLQI